MPSPKPLVTVVIPCHNYAAYVTDAIRSVRQQTLNNLECFVMCDACTDNSVEVALEAVGDDARFEVIATNNKSLSATRNEGIKQGSAPFLCCLDADDEMGSEEYLETIVTELEKDRTVGIGFSSIQVMDANRVLGHVPAWPNGWNFDQQCAHINQIPSLCVFRRDMWQRAGGFRPYYRYVEDAEFWTTCGMIGFSARHVTTQPWFHYRLHDKSASQVHRTGEIPEPDWLEFHPSTRDGQRPFAACGTPPRGSWPVRFYNEPDVTIIIPVGRGHEEIVKDALHSVEGQTYRNWECIVVNDTGYRLDLTGFPWAKEFSTKELGAGGARNCGLHYARAPHVVFLDADDMLKPDFLAEALQAYRRNGRYVYTDWLTHERMTNWQIHETPEYSLDAIRAKPSLHPVTALVPRLWALAVGGFDEELPAMEDVDFFMRLLTHGYCGVRVAKPLMIYNLDTGGRRKGVENDTFQTLFKSLLKKRYGKFMEDNKVCDCITPPKGKQPAPPTPENAEAYRETYGSMVLAQLEGRFTPEAPAEFRGPATRVSYGRRAKHDVFYIWEADLLYGDDTFVAVENFVTTLEPTIIPPAPPELQSLEQAHVEQVAGALGVPASEFEAEKNKLSPDQFAELVSQRFSAEQSARPADQETHTPSPEQHNNRPLSKDEWQGEYIDGGIAQEDEHHKMSVGERNDTLPPEQSHGKKDEDTEAARKKAERNAKDRERRAKKAAKR